MVIKAIEGFEPEWGFGGLLILILGSGKEWPGNANIFAIWLKEYHNCHNTIECQFFIYIRETPEAEKMLPGYKDVWCG